MGDPERARTTALALCAAAVMTAVMAAVVYSDVLDLGFDDWSRQAFTALLVGGVVLDLVMARVMYVRLSGRK